ncbi:polysaccharide biosynthesis protein [Paenibacillus sp. GCM10012307]|uniref:Polysaccharide biosynthesis protein n=1 Tax=Paenibacillus roseus TaxID=2798579 RepID=A0A934MQN2_9BACL|nr:polysaccharide biosynthesis protein [Paenibacillus roseus]MBJ6362063.1 polysaccharide biosynthesis protein [Paenibacillus roseus]
MFENAVILVTGGTGSWGHELVSQLLLQNPREVIVYSRNESSQVTMMRELDDARLKFRIGDVRDREALVSVCSRVDYVFHLAALKHVDICEEQPNEALKTNVGGTQNIIEAAIAGGVKKVINISTDKAADPVNFYGMTKAIGEKLITYANSQNSYTRFINVRGGNILGSSGSVLHLFRDQIMEGKQITITDKNMIRYFMTPQMASGLLLTAASKGQGGETFILKMPACKITDLAQVLIEAYEAQGIEMKEIGCRPGEKLHEILISPFESQHAVLLDDHYIVVLPAGNHPQRLQSYASCPSASGSPGVSGQSLMTLSEIRSMLADSSLLPISQTSL